MVSEPTFLVTAVAGFVSLLAICVSLFLLYRRTGHSMGLCVLASALCSVPFLNSVLWSSGLLTVTGFQYFSAVLSLVIPAILLLLALKPWPISIEKRQDLF